MPYCWLQQRPKAIFSFQLLNNNGQDSMEKLAGNLGLGSEFIELSILTTLFLYFLHKGLGDIRSRVRALSVVIHRRQHIKMHQSWHAISSVADIWIVSEFPQLWQPIIHLFTWELSYLEWCFLTENFVDFSLHAKINAELSKLTLLIITPFTEKHCEFCS